MHESAEVCAQLTRDLRAWAHEQVGQLRNATINSDDEDTATQNHYYRAAKWVIGLVEREKVTPAPPRQRQKRKRSSIPASPSPLLSGGDSHTHTNTNTVADSLSHAQTVSHKEGRGRSVTSLVQSTVVEEEIASTVSNITVSATTAISSSPSKGRRGKNERRNHNISSRFVNTLLNFHDASDSSTYGVSFQPMQTAFLSSLQFRVGVRYLFCHLNACEHFLYFSDVYLRSTAHPYSLTAAATTTDMSTQYPKLLFRGHTWRRKCNVCNLISAKCVVFDDRLTVDNPTFFCEHCYHSLHYDQEGVLLYDDFKVFPYLHDMV